MTKPRSTSYSLVVRAHWDDRDPIELRVDEVPNDISPRRVCDLLRPLLILGRARLVYRELRAGLHQVVGSKTRKRIR